jgi:Protein of unknown function (DUF1761)
MPQINYFAVTAAAISTFLVGGLWYSPILFGKVWQREAGLNDQQLANSNMVRIFGAALLLSLVAALVFAVFLGPRPSMPLGLGAGFSAGLCWVASSIGINYLFSRRSFKLFLIDGGYHTLQFTMIGVILALWH